MQRRSLLLAIASLATVAILGCAKDAGTAAAGPELRPLTVDQVAARLAAKDGKTFIFDNNPKEVWVKGHVPTATWLDDENVTAAALPKDKAATLIFYCHNES
jgi:hypothetical protein